MAEFFKSAARAGAEVRRLGQVGPEAEQDQSLRYLANAAKDGMGALPPMQPRRGIARPTEGTPEDSIAAVLAEYEKANPVAEAPAPQSDGTLLGDISRSVARGGLALGGGLYEIGNLVTGGALDSGTQSVFGTSGTEAVSSARELLNQADSTALQEQRKELENADGFVDSFVTVLTNPRLAGTMAVEMVPQIFTVVGAARMAAGRAIASAAAKGATKEAAELAGQRAATRTALGLNAGLEGGMASQDVRSDIMRMSEAELANSPQYQALITQGVSSEDARARLANDAATVAAATAGSISLLSGGIFGTIEGSLAARGIAGSVAPRTFGEAAKQVAIGAAKETGQETFEESGSQFGQNLGKRVGINPEQDLMEGVPEAGGAGGALGLLVGGAGSVRLPRSDAAAPAQPTQTDGSQTPGGPTPPAPSVMSAGEFQQTIQSEAAVPFMAALYSQSDENTRSQLDEIARRNNINVSLADLSQDANVVRPGMQILSQNPSFARAFVERVNVELRQEDETPLPPKSTPFTDEQAAMDMERFGGDRQAQIDANVAEIEADARAMGLEPRINPEAQAEDQAISQPATGQDLDTLMRGYQRRAQNISGMPPGARRAAATSSISEMVGAGFTPEEANAVFGPLTSQDAPVAEVNEPAAAVPAEIASQVTAPTEPIADTNIGDAGGAPDVPTQSAPPPAVSQAPAPLQTVPSNVQAPVTSSVTTATPTVTPSQPSAALPPVTYDKEKDQYTASSNGVKVVSGGPIEVVTFDEPRLGIKFIQVDGRTIDMYDQNAATWMANDFDRNKAKAAGLTKEQFQAGYKILVKLESDGASVTVSKPDVIRGWDAGKKYSADELYQEYDQLRSFIDPAILYAILKLDSDIKAAQGKDVTASQFVTPFITQTFNAPAYQAVIDYRGRVADDFRREMMGGQADTASAVTPPAAPAPSQTEPTGFVVPTTISTADGPFIVKNAPTGKKRADDSPVHAFVSRSGKVVSFDEKSVRDQFPNKVWTEPKVEGVIALPEDAFATADEWVEFVFRHEEAHIKNPRMDGETTAEYENRMNQIALTQMKGQEYADAIYKAEAEPAPVEAEPAAAESVPEASTTVPETSTASPALAERFDRLSETINKLQQNIATTLEQTRQALAQREPEPELVFRPGTPGVEQDSPLARGRNPNIKSGSLNETPLTAAPDVQEQDRMRKEAKTRRAQRLKEKRPATKPAPRRAPTRQGELGETAEVRRFQARAQRIMTQLVSRSAVADQIKNLDATLERLQENRTFGRSQVEYIFNQFAQAGALSQEDMDDLGNQERNRERITALRDKINQLQKQDMANRAEAIRLNIQAVDDALADLRIDMEQAGLSQNVIDDVLLDKEMGVQAVIDGRVDTIPEIESVLEENNETPEENMQLFGDESAIAAQIVDAIGNEADVPRTLMALRNEAESANVGNLDIYNEMRRRGIEVKPELVSFASRPGVRFTLEYWMRANKDRNPYIVREEWFGSLDLTLRQTGNPDAMLDELSQDERKLYDKWKSERDALRSRLKKGDRQNETGDYIFDSLDTAFPHALFNKYPLSSMFDVTKIPEADRPGLLTLVDGDADNLPTLWYSDLSHVLSTRPDLEGQVRETISEEEYAKYEEYRTRKTRELLRNSKMMASSPAFSQLFQLKTFLTAEQYQQYFDQIAVANQNQQSVILQTAFEIAEAQRAAQESGRDVDDATDAIMDAVYANDEINSASPEQMAEATSTIDTDEPSPFPDDVSEQPAPDSDPSDFIDRMRMRRGRYSGVVSAAEIFAHLNKITSGWKNSPRIQVLNNVMQLPENIRDAAIAKLGRNGAKGMVAPDGTVYVFSDFNENLADAEFTFFHEVYGHFGLRQFLGDKLDPFLTTQYKVNKDVKAAADALIAEAEESGRGMSVLEATEEAIADLAVTSKDPGLFLKITRALIKALRSIKMRNVADWMESKSGADLAYVLSASRRAVREGRDGPLAGAPFDFRYNASKLPVEIFATKGDKTTAYARYNPVLHQWTVFWDKDGLKAQNFGITTVESYQEAFDIVKDYGRPISSRDFPGRSQKDPSSFKLNIPFPSDVKGWKRNARMAQIKLQNKLLPIYEVARWINANGGNTNLEQVIKLHRGQMKYHMDEFNRKYLRPISTLLDTLEKGGVGIDQVDLYLSARHAKERNARVREINPSVKDGSGISDSDAARILNEFEGQTYINELRGIGMLLDGMSRAKIDYQLQHGLISEAQAAALNTYEHYVNLSGNKSDSTETADTNALIKSVGGRSINLRGSDARRATGRATQAVDVLQNTLNSYIGTIIRGKKNLVAQSVLQMVEDHPDPTFAIVNRIKQTRKLDVERLISDKAMLRFLGDAPTPESGKAYLRELAADIALGNISEFEAESQVRQRLEEAYERNELTGFQLTGFVKKLESASLREGLLNKDGYITEVEDTNYMNKDNVFVVKENGKPVTIEFAEGVNTDDKFGTFVSALHGMHNYSDSQTLGAFGAFNRFIGQLITSRNLTWVPVNWIRDIGTAFFNAAVDPKVGPELARKMAREAPKAYAVAFKDLIVEDYGDKNSMVYKWLKKLAKKPISAADKQMFEEFKKDGGETYFLDRKDILDQIKSFQRELNPETGLTGAWESYGKFADLLGQPAELSARYAAYKVLRQAGRSRQEAAEYAKEITVNFEQSGSSAWIRSLLLFFNPSVQGTARMFRDYSKRSGAGKLVPSSEFGKVAAGLIGLGALMGFVARSFGGGEDDDEINDLDQIPSGKRATSVVIVPGVPLGAPIPLPYGWNVFYAMGNFAMDSLFGDTPVSQTASRIASSAVNSFWPAGARDSGNFLKDTALSFVPTAVSPVLDIWMNENRFGAPIAKERNPFTNAEEANAYMNFQSASPVSVYLMRNMNELFGGNQYKSSSFLTDLNPGYVDYLFSSYLPGLPTDVGRTVNMGINAAIGRDIKNPPLPLIDRFGSKISEGWDAGAFRRAQTYIETRYKEAMTVPEAQRQEILKEHPQLGGAQQSLSIIDQDIRNMRTSLRTIESDPNRSLSEKVAARNKVEEMEKQYYKQGVALAIKAGFKEKVIADN